MGGGGWFALPAFLSSAILCLPNSEGGGGGGAGPPGLSGCPANSGPVNFGSEKN